MPLSYVDTVKLYSSTSFVVAKCEGKDVVLPYRPTEGIRYDLPVFLTDSVDPAFFNLLSASAFMYHTLASSVAVVENFKECPDLPDALREAMCHFEANIHLALSCATVGPMAASQAAANDAHKRKPL